MTDQVFEMLFLSLRKDKLAMRGMEVGNLKEDEALNAYGFLLNVTP